MKRLVLAVLVAVLLSSPALADVPWVPFYEGRYLGSFELLLSGEYRFSSRVSLGLWGGGAYVYTRRHGNGIHTLGLELAVEPRLILLGRHDRGLFLGAYLGTGWMLTPEYYRSQSRDRIGISGVSRGAKLGYRLTMAQTGAGRVLLEPYISISKATYDDGSLDNDSNVLRTFGLRLVFSVRE